MDVQYYAKKMLNHVYKAFNEMNGEKAATKGYCENIPIVFYCDTSFSRQPGWKER